MTRNTNKNPAAPKTGAGAVVDQVPPSGESDRKVTIRSATPSLRRAGIAFTRDGVVVECDELSRDQIVAILSEPLLTIDMRDQLAELVGDESTGD